MENSSTAGRTRSTSRVTNFYLANHVIPFLFFCFTFFLPLLASASTPLKVERAYYIDTQSEFDINSVANAPFKNTNSAINLGYRLVPIWIRLQITSNTDIKTAPPIPGSETIIVRVGSHDLNTIELYEFDAGTWHQQIDGDIFPPKKTMCEDDYYCFLLKDQSPQARTVYLKVQSPSFLTIDPVVVSLADLPSVSGDRIKRIYISLTVAFGMLIMGLILLAQYRSALTHIYCWFQASVLLYLYASYGVLSSMFPGLPPAALDASPHIFFMIRTFFTLLGVFVIIKPYCDSVLYKRSMVALMAMCLINCLLFLMDYRQFALKSNVLIFALHANVQFYGLIKSKGIDTRVRSIMIFAYVCTLLVISIALLPWVLPNSIALLKAPIQNLHDWRLNGIPVGLLVILLVKFETDFREKIKRQELSTLRLDKAKASANETQLADRNTLIDLITHDLKNPLGTIKFASTSLKEQLRDDSSATHRLKHIDLCVSRMNKLIEHVALSARVDRYEPTELNQTQSVCDLVDELTEVYPDGNRFDISITDDATTNADREMLNVIFGNLIENAYKYGHAGSKIMIAVTRENSALSGTGLPSAAAAPAAVAPANEALTLKISNTVGVFGAPDTAHIFERYYRNPNSLIIPGMGIGLSLVQAAANKINSTVKFEHLENTVTFTVRIPA